MPESLDLPAIDDAARRLERGELVAFPTETVYGLGADAENPVAVAKIYLAKGRPSNHPVIVHLAPEADLAYWAQDVSPAARKLIAAFWPGPLTIIFKRAAHIPDTVSGGQDSIGLRCPSHPVAQALLRAFKHGKGGIAAPSANKFGHVSPTTAQHVRDEFSEDKNGLLNCILEGGQSEVGIESTIIDLSRGHPVLLRPGHISAAQIAAVLGVWPALPDQGAPRASGTLESHYAPHTPVALVDGAQLRAVLQKLQARGRRVALMQHAAEGFAAVAASVSLPATPAAYAHDLYAALRAMDQVHADVIVVQAPPIDDAWSGVNDRLRRAAHDSAGILSRLLQD
ncbi:L-threonylcarbamoyladenylate synthase [Herminiimonas sp.]|uniref:L-threonylcarbamoyladenylate synthase n=1 Tax=Herminiimonas sp. TaxID=1926289 RepID=UPI00271AA0BD|nr:L-threonylcarbamoyladenylate synthase [Herminiimonas sp.]MDO8304881.1 L-threonylcarbamoyladenylate synthase [Herminiimonas sp.]